MKLACSLLVATVTMLGCGKEPEAAPRVPKVAAEATKPEEQVESYPSREAGWVRNHSFERGLDPWHVSGSDATSMSKVTVVPTQTIDGTHALELRATNSTSWRAVSQDLELQYQTPQTS